MKDKIKFIPFLISDYAYLEKYLEDKAQEGIFLESLGFFYGKFSLGKPHRRKYCVIPNAGNSISKEETIFYEEAGWHHVHATGSWSILYTDSENATSLFTDESSFIHHTKWYTRMVLFICIAYIPLLWNMINTLKLSEDKSDMGFIEVINNCFLTQGYASAALIMLTIVFIYIIVKWISNLPSNRNLVINKSNYLRIFSCNLLAMLMVIISLILMVLQGI